jgi:hypothetical protein
MDRDELQDRIRARRSGGDPYRRGGVADEGAGGYQRFEPEPEDAQARRSLRPGEQRRDAFDERAAAARGAAGGGAAASWPPESPDITRDADDWTERPSLVPPLPPSEAVEPAPPPFADAPAYVDNYDDAAEDEAGWDYDDWEDGRERRSSGAGAFAILGFLALGVLALLAGAVLAGVFSSEPGVGGTDPTLTPSPSIQESTTPSESASAAPTNDASTSPSSSPPASGEPVVFPDGFTAEAQPCIPGSASTNGCGSNASSNSGSVWIWVGFAMGTSDDVIGAEIIGPDGDTVGTGSIDLASIRCGRSCNGWTYFQFGNLDAGTYEVKITRNGDLAAETNFEVT